MIYPLNYTTIYKFQLSNHDSSEPTVASSYKISKLCHSCSCTTHLKAFSINSTLSTNLNRISKGCAWQWNGWMFGNLWQPQFVWLMLPKQIKEGISFTNQKMGASNEPDNFQSSNPANSEGVKNFCHRLFRGIRSWSHLLP